LTARIRLNTTVIQYLKDKFLKQSCFYYTKVSFEIASRFDMGGHNQMKVVKIKKEAVVAYFERYLFLTNVCHH